MVVCELLYELNELTLEILVLRPNEVFLEEFFQKMILKKKISRRQKHEKLPSMQSGNQALNSVKHLSKLRLIIGD